MFFCPGFIRLASSLIAAATLMVACKPTPSHINLSNLAQLRLTGELDMSSLPDGASPLAATVIGADGERHTLALDLDRASGRIALQVTREYLLPLLASPAERWTAMASRPSPPLRLDRGQLAAKAFAYARFEVGVPASANAARRYRQLYAPISRELAFDSQKKNVAVVVADEQRIHLKEVGERVVKVTASDGQALADALVLPINLAGEGRRQASGDPNFIPVAHRTDAKGEVLVYPLRRDGVEPSYQMVALHAGYCAYVTEPVIYQASDNTPLSISLDPCPDFRLDDTRPAMQASFPPETYQVKGEDGVTRAYVNQDEVVLRLQAMSPALRGVEMVAYEGDRPEGKVIAQQSYPTFSSRPSLRLPAVFPGSGKPEGKFVIGVRLIFDDSDRTQYGEANFIYLHGLRSRQAAVLNLQSVLVKSRMGVPGVVSGVKGVEFTVETPQCAPGAQIGLSFRLSTQMDKILFQACDQGPSTWYAKDLGLESADIGGPQSLYFYYRDAFGNLNQDGINRGDNKLSVYVDYGVPRLSEQPVLLLSDFGIAEQGRALGSLPSSLSLSPSHSDTYVFRFASLSACRHTQPSLKDGTSLSEGMGHRLAAFRVSTSAERRDDPTAFTACGKDLPFNSLDVSWQTGQALRLYYQVIDVAGNVSDVAPWDIPSCVSATNICWSFP